ncbi:MAG TPA: hypothetical protein PK668_13540 [Myxococcota bacterium]|nr:hypothetical protein [Myxococcota bacterium]HRY94114.1 hypothetical protein [Myxococcota bacterium]HSA23261.1 hypothetical protein [Myxococcota bacterium]
MRPLRTRLATWAGALCALLLAGCPASGPDPARPWALVLAEAASAAEAAELAEALGAERPELEGATAVSLPSPAGPARHLVLSRPLAERAEAEQLRAALLQGRAGQLELLDFRTLPPPVQAAAPEPSAPEEAAELERLAAWLPEAAGAELEDLLLLSQPERLGRSAGDMVGWAAPAAWARAHAGLGWSALAQARYRLGEGSQVRVFVGLVDPAQAEGPDALRRVFDFLEEHVRSAEPLPPPEAAPPPRGAKAKKKAKAPARRGKRPPPPPAPAPALGADGELALVPVVKELPAPQAKLLPWGPGEVFVVGQVAFVPTRHIQADTGLATAWLAWLPERKGVALFLFDDPARGEPWLAPRGLRGSPGLQLHPWVRKVWSYLPDATMPGERLDRLGATRLGAWAPAGVRKLPQIAALAERPVLFAGYRSDKLAWQLLWVQTGDPQAAKLLFEQGIVQPRQQLIQAVLGSKRAVSYDVGVTLRELGDVQAWQLLGAAEGRLQELYFQRGDEVWLVTGSGPQSGEAGGRMSIQDLLGRADSLPFWPASVE